MGIEDLLDDISAEEARAASEAMADIEFDNEIQTRLPEDLRYGGLYGLIPYLGMQGQGDQEGSQGRRAVIKPKGMPRRGEKQKISTTAGSYYLPYADADSIANKIDQGMGLDFYQGSYPQPDEIRYFQGASPILEELELLSGYFGLDNKATTINHELFHRGQSLPFLEDMLEGINAKMNLADRNSFEGGLEYNKLEDEEFRLNDLIDLARSHYYLDALDERRPELDRRRLMELEDLQDDIKNYLTPERQEGLGVRLPTPAAKPRTPGLMERLEDYAKDIF